MECISFINNILQTLNSYSKYVTSNHIVSTNDRYVCFYNQTYHLSVQGSARLF